MGYRDYFDTKPTLGNTSNSLVLLFAANAFVFLILNFLKVAYTLDYGTAAESLFVKKVLYWFTLSPQAHELLSKPWSVLVYMISHYSTWGFISNMLWLWAFGYVLQDLTGNRKLIPVYLYGGFVGGLFFVASATYITSIQQQVGQTYLYEGCNAAVIAIAVATTTVSHRYRIFQHIGEGFPLWILTLIYLAVDIVYVATNNVAVGIAHLAAAIMGYVFIKQLQKGKDWSNWMYGLVNKIDDLFNPEKKHKRTRQVERVFYKTQSPVFTKTMNVTERKVDEILDKINKIGYDKLSKEEKDFLERASKDEE